jgi:hypothetical protein
MLRSRMPQPELDGEAAEDGRTRGRAAEPEPDVSSSARVAPFASLLLLELEVAGEDGRVGTREQRSSLPAHADENPPAGCRWDEVHIRQQCRATAVLVSSAAPQPCSEPAAPSPRAPPRYLTALPQIDSEDDELRRSVEEGRKTSRPSR